MDTCFQFLSLISTGNKRDILNSSDPGPKKPFVEMSPAVMLWDMLPRFKSLREEKTLVSNLQGKATAAAKIFSLAWNVLWLKTSFRFWHRPNPFGEEINSHEALFLLSWIPSYLKMLQGAKFIFKTSSHFNNKEKWKALDQSPSPRLGL